LDIVGLVGGSCIVNVDVQRSSEMFRKPFNGDDCLRQKEKEKNKIFYKE